MEFRSQSPVQRSPKNKLHHIRTDYLLYGQFIWYSGVVLIFSSLFFLFSVAYRLTEVKERPKIMFGSQKHKHELQEQYMEVYDHYIERSNSKNPLRKFANNSEDDRAVILGFKESLEFIFIVDCLLCIAIFAQGLLMIMSTRKVSEITKGFQINGSEEFPELHLNRLESLNRLEL